MSFFFTELASALLLHYTRDGMPSHPETIAHNECGQGLRASPAVALYLRAVKR